MKIACIVFLLLMVSCNPGPYVQTNKQYMNYNLRKPNLVIIHHTAQNSCDQTLRTFTLERTQVSAHYVICRNGTIHHMLNDYLRAWHGGSARWGNINDINSSSIGIELDNNGAEPFAPPQINSLLKLLQNLKNAYAIPTANFIGHADIAPTRKTDPSHHFSWKQLADKGFGHWYDTAHVVVPPSFNHIEALRIIGYDTRDSAASFHAFRLHFLSDTLRTMDSAAQKVLFSVYKKYL
jgi:N-acetylmuramoyl-L-alanine amidase